MPKICYVPKTFRGESLRLIEIANVITDDYEAQGFDLTLRQLYYQFVARGYIENSERSYKRLGSLINDARLAGLIDWERITDRTRNLQSNSHWSDPGEIINSAARSYGIDKWADQDNRPEVWVEKEALAGVVAAAAEPMDVSYFSCRGYTSQSEMWAAAMRLIRYYKQGQMPVIFHIGDHDPSGIDMSRDILDRIAMFMERHLGGSYTRPFFRFERLALNMSQVEQYNPPPNPAKTSDARFLSYLEAYGDESWELDALEPSVLVKLIQDNIAEVRDDEKWDAMVERENHDRASLETASERWNEVEEFLAGEDD